MDHDLVKRMEYIAAVQAKTAEVNARIAGFIAANMIRASEGKSLAYDEGHFFAVADELKEHMKFLGV